MPEELLLPPPPPKKRGRPPKKKQSQKGRRPKKPAVARHNRSDDVKRVGAELRRHIEEIRKLEAQGKMNEADVWWRVVADENVFDAAVSINVKMEVKKFVSQLSIDREEYPDQVVALYSKSAVRMAEDEDLCAIYPLFIAGCLYEFIMASSSRVSRQPVNVRHWPGDMDPEVKKTRARASEQNHCGDIEQTRQKARRLLHVAVEFWAAAAATKIAKKSSSLQERRLRVAILAILSDELRHYDVDYELRRDGLSEVYLYQLVVGNASRLSRFLGRDDNQETLTKLMSLFPWPEEDEEMNLEDCTSLYTWIWGELPPELATTPANAVPHNELQPELARTTTNHVTQSRQLRRRSAPEVKLEPPSSAPLPTSPSSSAPSPTSPSSSAPSPTSPSSSAPSPTSSRRIGKPIRSPMKERARRSGLSDRTITRKSRQLRDAVFGLGDVHCIKEVLQHFMDSTEMRRLLPEHHQKTTKEALVQEQMVVAARKMLSDHFATKGKRNTDDRNFFVGALAAMLPENLSELRLGKQVQRSLGVSKNQVRRAIQIRRKMMDKVQGWCRLTDKPHCDRVDGAIIEEAWHDDLLSREDNSDKRPVRIPIGIDEETGEKQYCIHWKRTQVGTDKDALATFRNSSFCQRVREQTKTKTRPNGVKVGMKVFLKFRCRCVNKKKAGECDCPICTFIYVNLQRYHKARTGWYGVHTVTTEEGGKVQKNKNTCNNPGCGGQCMNLDSAIRRHSRSLRDLESMSMCQRVPLTCVSTPTLGCVACQNSQAGVCEKCVFTTYHLKCALGICKNCPRQAWPKECSIEWSPGPASWEAYVPVQVGVDEKTGKPRYQDMLLPQYGTRADFMEAWKRGVERYLPHITQNRIQRQMKLRVEHRKGPKMITKLEDFAA